MIILRTAATGDGQGDLEWGATLIVKKNKERWAAK